MHTVPVVVVFGPTAVGKTDFLLHFEHSGEIINSDSLQVYRHMSIGTAKPDESVIKRIPHHLVDCMDPDEEFSAGDFVKQADKLCREIYERGRIPIISGGTGFFLKNFIYGLPTAPASSEEIRQQLQKRLETEGLEALREELREKDPDSWARIKPQDSYRILRALEVCLGTGKPFSSFARTQPRERDFQIEKIGLARPREDLYRRIDARVDLMFRDGLIKEVRSLTQFRNLTALNTVGYKEVFTYLDNPDSVSLDQTIALVKQDTRHYAKRQMTWWNRDGDIRWINL